MKRTALALAVALALGGCFSLPPKKARVVAEPAVTAMPKLTPGTGATLKAGLSIERWWKLLGDAELDALMDEALARNEDLEAAVARVREAQASLNVADAARSPTLDLQASTKRQQVSAAGATPLPRGVDREQKSHRVSFEAGYEVDLWGKLSAGSAAARQQLLAQEWARTAIEWGLTARLAESYFGLAAVDRQIEVSEAVRNVRQDAVRLRGKELEAGVNNEFELRRAQAELTAAESTLASLGRQRAALERAVTVLLGRNPQEIATKGLKRNRLDEAQPLAAVLPQGGADQLLARRPDIRQAEAQLAAANYSIEAARAAALPSVRLTGSLGTDAKLISSLFTGPAAVWAIAASVGQSIVDGGRAKGRVNEEHARAQQALASYRKTVSGAVLDVQEAYAALEHNQQALQAERERVAALARARDLARRGFESGALAYLDLLDADRNLYQAQLQQVAAYRDQLVGQVSAFKALGGGYAHNQKGASQ